MRLFSMLYDYISFKFPLSYSPSENPSLIIILKIMNFVHSIYLEKFFTHLKSNIYKGDVFANSEGTLLMFDKFVL